MKKLKLKKNKKTLVISAAIAIFVLTIGVAFGRYVLDFTRNFIMEARGFYFNSTSMSSLGTNHNIGNWDGVNPYVINIDLNSKKNDYVKTEVDVAYDVNIECSSNVRCETSKSAGTIFSASSEDSYTVTVYPQGAMESGDVATVRTSATSNSPYEKTLSTTYEIGITTYSFSYQITDSAGSKYLELELNNAFSYYEVVTAFGSYSVGDHIGIEDYNALTDAQKNNCKSAVVTLTFNPNIVRLDMTNDTYLKKATNVATTAISGANYVRTFRFKMNANNTTKIMFYKQDTTQNYAYPGNTSTPIVTVSVDTVG